MDNNHHYSSNVINTSSAASYPSPSAISPHHLQNGQNQTLPPLQHHHNPAMSMYASHPHTPRTPATPNTPNSMGSYAPPPSQPGGRGYPMMHNPYQQPQQSYATSSAMMPQTSVSSAHPQPIAPAPSPGGRVPPVLRPMPAGGVMPQSGLASPYAQSPMMGQPSILHQENDQPTHVVGSQGRRGILPSAPGRPAAPAPGTAAAKAQIPQKDADGKFPCPHCTKTYLHAKHLKRHMLRHTGDRPYMCVLCRDTFSRSDILKRHFQKCSIRRGNPTGVSHLSHPHAHVKKAQAAAAKAASMGHHEGDMSHMNGMNNVPGGNMVPFGLIPAADQMSHMSSNPNDQSQLSRSSSMNRLDDGNPDDRRSVPAPVMATSTQQQYNGSVPTSMATQMNPQMANYNMQQNQNGVPMFNGGSNSNQQSGLDWQAMFSQQGQAGAQLYNNLNSSCSHNNGQTQTAIKPEPNSFERPSLDGLAASASTDVHFPPKNWRLPTDKLTYQSLSDKILQFFNSSKTAHQSVQLNVFFSADNIQHFLVNYSHFAVHFSILHMPTFDVANAYFGLLAVMCCIGACYSPDRVSASHVREYVGPLKAALESDPRIVAILHNEPYGTKSLEELQSLVLLHVLLVWHGTPATRQASRQVYNNIVHLVRKLDLLRVSQDSMLFSHLHQPDFSLSAFEPSRFEWGVFVEQEKRCRLMHLVWVMDTAEGLYFNVPPSFDIMEMAIPLPCDDAAFEAPDARSCAEALGLYGSELAKARNPDGTQRPKQPELRLAINALMHSSYQIQTGSTNLMGKFIIIHSILALIRRAQVEGSSVIDYGHTLQNVQGDWIVNSGLNATSVPSSANNSGRSTPVDGSISPKTMHAIRTALSKFKQNWDMDYVTQFQGPSNLERRHGFFKDAIPFYALAQYLLKNTLRGDLELPSEHRFVQVIHLLKSMKSWVKTDGASRGEEMGSVGEIDRDFGTTNLTLDMTEIFRPRVMESMASIKIEEGSHVRAGAV